MASAARAATRSGSTADMVSAGSEVLRYPTGSFDLDASTLQRRAASGGPCGSVAPPIPDDRRRRYRAGRPGSNAGTGAGTGGRPGRGIVGSTFAGNHMR